jgi:hypothetical protein
MIEEGNPACSFRVKRGEEKSPPESSLVGIDFRRISCQYYVAIKENFVRKEISTHLKKQFPSAGSDRPTSLKSV